MQWKQSSNKLDTDYSEATVDGYLQHANELLGDVCIRKVLEWAYDSELECARAVPRDQSLSVTLDLYNNETRRQDCDCLPVVP